MKRNLIALSLFILTGLGALVSAAPAPAPTPQPEPRAIGDTWTNTRGIKFTYIPAGEFDMGSPPTEAQRADNETQHHVKLTKPFLLGIYTVTQGQWKAVMNGANPSFFKGDDNLPVEEVSWTDATRFCQQLSSADGRHYRLPTEAEWEYACRAGTATPFNTGETLTSDQANFNSTFPYGNAKPGINRDKTVAVGSFKPNAWGLYDMHGNVWQWCQDWLGNYPAGPAADPTGPRTGSPGSPDRVYRGGSYGYLAENCRSAVRYGVEGKSSDLGFRVALDIR